MSAEYQALLDEVLTRGVTRHGEKPEATLTVTDLLIKQDFSDGFPLLTIRDLSDSFERIITREPLWMISGSTSAKDAREKFGLKLWDRWAKDSEVKLGTPPDELGPVYGHQLRHWHGNRDQLSEIVKMLKEVPETRRGYVGLWDIEDVQQPDGTKVVNVANCVIGVKFTRMDYKLPDGSFEPRLDMGIIHRSADIPAGVPHDIGAFSILLMMVAKEVGIKPGSVADHILEGQIYEMQIPAVLEMLKREPFKKPTVEIVANHGTIYEYRPEDFVLVDYVAQPKIKVPTAT